MQLTYKGPEKKNTSSNDWQGGCSPKYSEQEGNSQEMRIIVEVARDQIIMAVIPNNDNIFQKNCLVTH